ncbi:hypothetical protein [Sulfurimonas sp. HSL3-7]|uniref:hypothetical protein n=1 Tax=Sulfonitrofixus jiaomeiensis TaxID=3131938 RepID=UPI0031F801D1
MSAVNEHVKETLKASLRTYYNALKKGDLQTISALMTKESYQLTLESLGFKRAFRDDDFKKLLRESAENNTALKEVERFVGADLAQEAREHRTEVIRFESKGSDRITLHYEEDCRPKKLYFSLSSSGWKIDYKAGRKKS